MALLKDIAEYNGINIEPVIMESASGFTAQRRIKKKGVHGCVAVQPHPHN